MDSKASYLLCIALLCFVSTSTAFNITKILANYPEFGNFNDLLSQSGLAQQINSRQTITVLVVDNGNLDDISGRPMDIAKRILSAHVILDYYDQTKLSKLQKKSNILTTLYQASGIADNQQGFLNVSRTPDGIKFGSAMKGAPLSASLVKSVYSQPYNVSVLQVSEIIQTPGIENMAPPPPAGSPKKAPAPTPSKAPAGKAPAPAEEEPSSPPAETPTEGPAADTPAADAPKNSAPEADSPEAADDKPAPAPAKAGSSRVHVGGVVVVMGLVACMMGY